MLHSNFFNYNFFAQLPGDKLEVVDLPTEIPSLFTFLKENKQPLDLVLDALGIRSFTPVMETITDTGQFSSRYSTLFKTNFTPTLAAIKAEVQTIGYL